MIICVSVFICQPAFSQNDFTRADSLRGMLTSLRTCFDVTYYHLDVRIDPGKQTVAGSNTIQFRATIDFKKMQLDLVEHMKVEAIKFKGDDLKFERDLTAIYIDFPEKLKKDKIYELTIFYGGEPKIARRPPWQGGLIWSADKEGNPWVAVTVQGEGAFHWWPNKEHQEDEPDSMLLSITIPDTLMNISNGRLRAKNDLSDGWSRWDWFISYPINNYNVTINIAKYAHFNDFFISEDGDTLTLDYNVLPYNLDKAKEQFKQVKPMFECFENVFGKYPFYRDGFKLVESPHLGMEHQSAVAYGNNYQNGYLGRGSSKYGILFDFIIVHETAHEWWGNSVTSKDIADMWVHESFGAYAEALYAECMWGYEAYLDYQNGKKYSIKNDRPIIGQYDVNSPGSRDMYSKGSMVLHTLRSVVDNDSLWFEVLRGIQKTFAYKTITSEDIFDLIIEKTGKDLTSFFNQYFRHTNIPELQTSVITRGDSMSLLYKWSADVADFNMPVKVTTANEKYEFIYPTTEFQTIELNLSDAKNFKVAEELFYINVKHSLRYRE